MNVSVHFITSLILSLFLYPYLGLYALWILVGGWLIDFDHYLWTLFRLKTLSLKKSYHYHFDRHKDKHYERDLLHLFHTGEFWLFMILSSITSYYFNQKFLFYMFTITFLGMILHLSLDFTLLFRKKHTDARAISIIAWIKRRN
ncbi:hypothetical protein HN992_01870 [Candidatus Woesearchaeota archaeon]|nr:hypothetical protein [Candidatus Woesearchaeota archaeon]MBT4207219.1 hypothetical protein [Candidatus Woesearchaeota archaeon]MBT4783496.1 hypothetical protein [Candidatus Woesearchaeota archaeon]MBT6941169.1 hypothetical protein [Candidatus Woesearchaeota archaeon]